MSHCDPECEILIFLFFMDYSVNSRNDILEKYQLFFIIILTQYNVLSFVELSYHMYNTLKITTLQGFLSLQPGSGKGRGLSSFSHILQYYYVILILCVNTKNLSFSPNTFL